MNFRKLITYLTMGTAAAMPLAVAQNPTILQGNYISNVFGNSNFVLNPNAQTNIANVTVSSATVTRSTTTPLVATSEFNITTSTSTGSATWLTRTFDSGMKGQNCEARFSYRGFSVGSTTAQILQGANVVAQLTLTASTDPRIASINFPCGDLSSATTFRLQQATASLTGTNEIGGIYVGLATNMANVAQAQAIFRANDTNGASITSGVPVNVVFPATIFDADGGYNSTTGTYTIRRAGRYFIHARVAFALGNPFPASIDNYIQINRNGSTIAAGFWSTASYPQYPNPQITSIADLNVGDQINIAIQQNTGGARNLLGSNALWSDFTLSRFPSSSELVVTPERQNVFGAVSWPVANTGSNYTFTTTSTTAQTVTNAGFASSSATYYGAASASTTANAFGMKVSNIPPGTYRISAQVSVHNQSAGFDCSAELHDDGGRIGAIASSIMNNNWANGQKNIVTIYRVTSFQSSREFLIKLRSDNAATTCIVNSGNGGVFNPSIVFEPLDQPSNSALYVQGPVKAAISNTAIPTDSIGGKVIDATASKTTTVTGTWQVASSNYGTPPAGSYVMIATIKSQGGIAGLTNSGFIINENGSSVTPVICQASTTSNSGDGVALSRICYYTTDGTKTLYGWFRSDGANSTINGDAILVRLN